MSEKFCYVYLMTFLQICYITSWHIGLKSEQKPFRVKYWKYYHWWVNMCSDVFRIAWAMQQASDADHTICLPICLLHKCIHFPGYKVHNNQLQRIEVFTCYEDQMANISS